MENDEILTREEAMKFCKCKRDAFRKFIAVAKVPICRHVGGKTQRFRKSQLLAGIRRMEAVVDDAGTEAARILGEEQ